MSGHGKANYTYEGLFVIMLRDQFLSICNRDLLLFTKGAYSKRYSQNALLLINLKKLKKANIQTVVSSSDRGTFVLYKCNKAGHISL